MVFAFLFALRAIGDAARIAFFLQILKASLIVRKSRKEGFYGEP